MRRYFLYLSYNGAPFCGWQKQPSSPSVQETLENALAVLLKRNVEVVGCGRTDTGVHADAYFAHFDWNDSDTSGALQNLEQLAYQLNSILPKAIAIHNIFEVPQDFHARFSATWRTYHYYIHTAKNPFLDDTSYYYRTPFNEEKIQQAAQRLCGQRDFTSFSKLHTQTAHNFCNLQKAEFLRTGQNRWMFVFTANRFLRNMVRAMTGTLLEVGTGRRTIEDIDTLLQAKDRGMAGNSVPAHALFLHEIEYF
ncbi:MAG: tRNA pseudouridine(38-40) synthase TruA [Bacteroidales bacterium]|nr:tRNA pseudouridine(38-40) synthase TruA [Bacteroidales bacterium]